MNYILISPNFTGNLKNFAICLKENGINVLGIGSAPYDNLEVETTTAITEYYKVDSLRDTEAVKRAVAFLFFKHGQIDYIESFVGNGLELDAELREQFYIPGLKPRDLAKVVSRDKMIECIIKANVPVFNGKKVKTIKQLNNAIDVIKLPLIVVPDSKTSSLAPYVLKTSEDVKGFKEVWDKNANYYIQEFVAEGQIYSLDGLLDQKGQIIYASSITHHDVPSTYHIDQTINKTLLVYGEQIARAFKIKERFFHIEFLKVADNRYFALNYNSYPASGFSVDLQNYVHSIDLYDIYAQIILGKNIVTITDLNSSYCLGITRLTNKDYKHTLNEVTNKYGQKIRLNLSGSGDLVDQHFFAIATESVDEIEEIQTFVTQTI